MKKIIRCLVYSLCMLLTGCGGRSNTPGTSAKGEVPLPVIDIGKALDKLSDKKLNFSNFVSDISYIPLESKKGAHVEDKLISFFMTDKHIFFSSIYTGLMFNMDGSLVRQMGRIGKGPGEFIQSRGIAADEKLQEFYVYAEYTHQIMIYDLDNNFKKSVPAPATTSGIMSMGDRMLFMSGVKGRGAGDLDYCEYRIVNLENGDTVRVKRSEGSKKLAEKATDYSKATYNNGLSSNACWYYNRSLQHYESLSDTIFAVSPLEETARYIVDCGKYKIPFSEIETAKNNRDYVTIGQISETSGYLFFSISLKDKLYYAWYDKNTGETHANLFDKVFNNDIDGGPIWLFNNSSVDNIGFYDFLPWWAKENMSAIFEKNSGYDKAKSRYLQELVDKADIEDNPIVYVFHLR